MNDKPMYNFWVALEYKCGAGHQNNKSIYFKSHHDRIDHSNFMPYLPREWPCSFCSRNDSSFVEYKVHPLTDSQFSERQTAAIFLP